MKKKVFKCGVCDFKTTHPGAMGSHARVHDPHRWAKQDDKAATNDDVAEAIAVVNGELNSLRRSISDIAHKVAVLVEAQEATTVALSDRLTTLENAQTVEGVAEYAQFDPRPTVAYVVVLFDREGKLYNVKGPYQSKEEARTYGVSQVQRSRGKTPRYSVCYLTK